MAAPKSHIKCGKLDWNFGLKNGVSLVPKFADKVL
jgi:hypothetical protein